MTIHVTSERQVIQEAARVLIKYMSPAKATRRIGPRARYRYRWKASLPIFTIYTRFL